MSSENLHNEQELLLKIAEGDEQAFEMLFNKYVPILHPYLLDMVKSRSSVEDAIQNTFIRIWLYRDKLGEIIHPYSWITRIAVRECLNILRKKRIEEKATEKLQEQANAENIFEQDIQYHQTKRFIEEAIAQLSPQRRKIYEMSRVQGLTVSEIADHLEISIQTVKNTLGITVESIRKYLLSKGITIPLCVTALLFY